MNLISCDNCGIALDGGKLKFPDNIETKRGELDGNLCHYHNRQWYPKVPCPVCKGPILDLSNPYC